ncbi:MFS transporter [Sporomusa sp. KB1]|uniref:MFS transporter n=1 Tax=Sporomusa sp. KB1 TaxID=943346 RepID=UPI0011A0B654|nr:MFS transporter [Sporomusa sp. KB1]
MDEPQLCTKDFVIDSIANFLIYVVYYILMVIIAIYAMDKLQASPSEAGFAAGIFILAALFARIFTGRSIEQVGRKRMLYIGLTIYLLSTFLYFKITNLPFLFFIRFLHGAGFGIAATATGTIVANIIPKERRGEGVGYYAMSTTLASAIGPFLGIYLNNHVSFDMIMGLCAILLAVSYIAVFFLKVIAPELTEEQLNNMKQFTLNNFIEFKALPIAIIGALLGFCFSSILSFLAPYTREINLIDAGSTFFVAYSVVILISRPVTGRLFDQKGENIVMYPSFILFAVGLIILSQVHHGFVLLLAATFLGLGWGTFLSSGQAIAINVSPQYRMGLATSTFFSLTDGGVGIGPFFLGFLVPIIGFRGLYVIMAIGTITIMCLYYFLHGCKVKRGNQLITEEVEALHSTEVQEK